MADQEIHEIQLNGKQLVFMFMAATVVSVVIFLCGVMVGRGVPVARADGARIASGSLLDPTPAEPADTTSGMKAGRKPVTPEETLTYAERLESPKPPAPTLQARSEPKPVVAPPAVGREAPTKAVAPDAAAVAKETVAPASLAPKTTAKPEPAGTKSEPEAAIARFSEPPGSGWAVQVKVFPTRAEAEKEATRLEAKGYRPFIALAPTAGPATYRVRVGKYPDKSDAEAVFRQLKQKENYDPWLDRPR